MAEAALVARCGLQKVAYFGLCMSEEHMNGLRERLEMFVLGEMKRKESPLWVPRFACAAEDGGQENQNKKDGGPEGSPEDKEKVGGKPKDKGTGKDKEGKAGASASKTGRKRKGPGKDKKDKEAKAAKKASSAGKEGNGKESDDDSEWDISSSSVDE